MIRFLQFSLFISLITLSSVTASLAQEELFEYGGDIRLDAFYSDNFDLNDLSSDAEDMYALEAHLWLQANMEDNVTARLNFELDRDIEKLNPANPGGLQTTDIESLDVYLEEAYLEFARIAASGLTVKLGRQFLNYGDNPDSYYDYNTWWGPGFIIGDSQSNTPLTLHQLGRYEIDPFDAAVVRYDQEFYSLDLLYARNPEDSLLGVSGSDVEAYLTGLYGSYYGIEDHQVDGYFTFSDQSGPSFSTGFDGERFILGGRMAGDLLDTLAYKTELAYQFENRNRTGLNEANALAAQVGLNYHPDITWKPNLGFIYTFLEQDGPPGRSTGFAAPFEGKTYGLIAEGLVKQYSGLNPFTNMHVFNLNGGLHPIEKLALKMDLYYLQLDEETAQSNSDAGFEIDTKADYKFTDWFNTYVGGGVFIPGDASEDAFGNNDNALFMHAGMSFQF